VGSRVRIAAAACPMGSGLFVAGASGALAFAVQALDSLGPDEGDGATTEPAVTGSNGNVPPASVTPIICGLQKSRRLWPWQHLGLRAC
jgi:hypothetical protein